MPVFDWTRSDLAKPRPDGSTVLSYDHQKVDQFRPEEMFQNLDEHANGFILPGWEPERMERIKELFAMYQDVNEEKLFENLVYFLKRIMPVCREYDIYMAIHPDDPAWPVFGLPRIITDEAHIDRMLDAVEDVHNGLTFCTGSVILRAESILRMCGIFIMWRRASLRRQPICLQTDHWICMRL